MRWWQPLVKFGSLAIGMALLLALMQRLFAQFRLDPVGGREAVLLQSVVVQEITAVAMPVAVLRTPQRAGATLAAILVVITLGAGVDFLLAGLAVWVALALTVLLAAKRQWRLMWGAMVALATALTTYVVACWPRV